MTKRLALLLLMLCSLGSVWAGSEQGEARRVFEEIYNKVFGPEGCTLHYNVNLVGVYKTQGTIWYKGKKSKFTDARVDAWNDGVTMHTVYRKKKVVEIFDATSDKRDKYASKFKFTLDDFDYQMQNTAEGLLFTLKQRPSAKGTIKHAKALVDKNTHAPIWVKVKVALFWANIRISDFRAGGIDDAIFVFPRQRYASGYRFEDRR